MFLQRPSRELAKAFAPRANREVGESVKEQKQGTAFSLLRLVLNNGKTIQIAKRNDKSCIMQEMTSPTHSEAFEERNESLLEAAIYNVYSSSNIVM
ncbi:MAG: hypothetical protein CL912_21225 [Deltaproteobacteria bacterium]|nr:hypothetical protein [Deltaproteobacteria bacterium]